MNALLKALGVTDEGDGLVMVARMNTFLASLTALFGTREFSESLAVISAHANIVTAIEKLTGKTGEEVIGILTAWKSAEERATTAEAKNTEIEKGIEATKAGVMIDTVISDKRLEPAKRDKALALYTDHGIGALTAFCDTLPAKGTAMGNDPTIQPPASGSGASADLTAEEKTVMKALGKNKAQMIDARRVQGLGTTENGEAGIETRFEITPKESAA